MQAPLEAFGNYLREAKVQVDLSGTIVREPDHDKQLLPPGERPRKHTNLGFPLVVEHDFPNGALGSDHATYSVAFELATMIPQLKEKQVLDLGCGTGLLGIQAAMAGANVIATDLDPEAIRLSERNATENGVKLDIRFGSLFDPIKAHEKFDLILANLPHKPTPDNSEALPMGQNGGKDGNALLSEALHGILNSQTKGGQILFFQHSLPDPRFLRELGKDYDLSIKSWKLRWLQEGEYGDLRQFFRQRHQDKKSFLWQEGSRDALVSCIWCATRKTS
ncbi:MAG: HemK-related putative methylase [Planctomycetota bacterium]|jgi:HemK-related putative methylase